MSSAPANNRMAENVKAQDAQYFLNALAGSKRHICINNSHKPQLTEETVKELRHSELNEVIS